MRKRGREGKGKKGRRESVGKGEEVRWIGKRRGKNGRKRTERDEERKRERAG